MTYLDKFETPEEALEHFGIKGMRWGVRGQKKPRSDQERFGDRGVRRISKRMASGKTHDQAVQRERARKVVKNTAVVLYGVLVARNLTQRFGPQLATHIVNSQTARTGARAAANLLADSHGLTSYSAINLTFNAAKNVWE